MERMGMVPEVPVQIDPDTEVGTVPVAHGLIVLVEISLAEGRDPRLIHFRELAKKVFL